MSNTIPLPRPLFDILENLSQETNSCVYNYIKSLPLEAAEKEYELSLEFLKSYAGSEDTYTAYRREIERLIHWAWLIKKKPIKQLDRNDIREFLEFVNHPPATWISTKNVSRFIDKEGERLQNPAWRPFVVRISKSERMQGKLPQKSEYRLNNKSIEALFAGISTFFTFLQQESFLEINPVQLIRQKSRFIRKEQSRRVTRKLSDLQWRYVIETIEAKANENPHYERHFFLISAFYLLGLRISELAETPGRLPKMSDFAPDKQGRWWFTTVGKGNKIRDVAVPDAMLEALKRYRAYLELTPLPTRGEYTPLIHKERGHGGLGTRQIRYLIQECFDQAIINLRQNKKEDEAQDLTAATVHWLRHTAISVDVENRPREHVRDDAGHQNTNITDGYIDIDRAARHESAKQKTLKPFIIKKETVED